MIPTPRRSILHTTRASQLPYNAKNLILIDFDRFSIICPIIPVGLPMGLPMRFNDDTLIQPSVSGHLNCVFGTGRHAGWQLCDPPFPILPPICRIAGPQTRDNHKIPLK